MRITEISVTKLFGIFDHFRFSQTPKLNECVPLMKPSGVLGVDLHGQVT
jgi:hypothetical protein